MVHCLEKSISSPEITIMDVIAGGTGKGPSNAMLFVDYLESQRVPYQWTPYEKKTVTVAWTRAM